MSEDISAVYLFGSELTVGSTPNDTDLLVITKGNAGSSTWMSARSICEHMRSSFIREFGIPLSIMLATPSEWAEIDGGFATKKVRLL